MKVIILAGGYGTRISEESHLKPKPMIEIGGKPILWHIMKYYLSYGHNEFIIAGGYKQNVIKEYFGNYFLHNSDITFDFTNGEKIIVHDKHAEKWKVTVVDTGLNTLTGGRVKRLKDYIGDEPFMLTYGDGVADVDLDALVSYHKKNGRILTITSIQPLGRFGVLSFNEDGSVASFKEKSKDDTGWINGGYMVAEPKLLDYIEGDKTTLERDPFEKLVDLNQIDAYRHEGFWQCMDTMRDKEFLEGLLKDNKAPWKKW